MKSPKKRTRAPTEQGVEIGQRIKAAIEAAGFASQAEFARHLIAQGWKGSATTVNLWVKGKAKITIENLERIASVLGVSSDHLLRGTDGGLL